MSQKIEIMITNEPAEALYSTAMEKRLTLEISANRHNGGKQCCQLSHVKRLEKDNQCHVTVLDGGN
jgi:hypothetical protein